ncbi:hypothetical protein K432DRAFT_382971 [Lepidopterella palustris CBS 459.81]|uniref:Uncharacterized protein n=1 Tax=Lepidopterella palustris CBS 459.81 TaxID=1314670 RepID=A0A8E2E9M4_9PEZI|nr:hypothetical protein K432DRAFT_382971 [Lepidopterella palustris CBS 459.81]
MRERTTAKQTAERVKLLLRRNERGRMRGESCGVEEVRKQKKSSRGRARAKTLCWIRQRLDRCEAQGCAVQLSARCEMRWNPADQQYDFLRAAALHQQKYQQGERVAGMHSVSPPPWRCWQVMAGDSSDRNNNRARARAEEQGAKGMFDSGRPE